MTKVSDAERARERDALVAEITPLVEKAASPNGWDWMFPLSVRPVDGKPTITAHKGGNLFRGYIGTWDEADLLVALANAAPRILAALRDRPTEGGVVERMAAQTRLERVLEREFGGSSPEMLISARQVRRRLAAVFASFAKAEGRLDGELASLQAGEAAPVVEGWRCFHCGDVFTNERCARLHFGRDEDSITACQITAGAEQGILGALRDAEYAAADARQAIADESTEAARAYFAQMTRHHQALRNAEEAGYERGLADGRALATPAQPVQTAEVVESLKAQVEQLREALEPFAAKAAKWERNHPRQEGEGWPNNRPIQHRLGDFRFARTTLSTVPQPSIDDQRSTTDEKGGRA